jgi:VanZ family protein
MIRNIARLSFTIGVLAVTWLSLTPRDALPEIDLWDKPQHLIAYAVLAICGAVGFLERRPWLIVGVGLIMLGCGLEVAQAAVPGRNPSIGDIVANIAGIALGLATAWIGDRLVGASEGSK